MHSFSKIFCLLLLTGLISRMDCSASDLEYGPYSVGFNSYKTYDDSRPYFLDKDTISRPLLIHFWYPSEETADGQSLHFEDYINLIGLRENYGRLLSEIEENSFNYVYAYSEFAKSNLGLDTSLLAQEILTAPVYARNEIPIQKITPGAPLLIYAPSNSKSSVQNHMICEYLASHGFMILSVASAGPTSLQRTNISESTMAQVIDMEHILKYAEDSLAIKYRGLGLFGFSSGGNALVLFQMRNEGVDAIFSMDGGQEYGAYSALYKMADFNLEKTNVPYASFVNNYKNFSIYPFYNSVITSEKYLFKMPYLDHNGFISHWRFFESCSSHCATSNTSRSYDIMSKCALEFLSKYLKQSRSLHDNPLSGGMDEEYIQAVSLNYSSISKLFHALLNNDLDSAGSLVKEYKDELFAEEVPIHLLARMLSDTNIDLAIWLSLHNAENHPDSWKVQYDLGYFYKQKGETLMAKNALLKAEALSPDNADISTLLEEVNNTE